MKFNPKKTLVISFSLIALLSGLFLAYSADGYASVNPRIISEKHVLTIGEAFSGEELVYEIDFWVFKEVAVGSIKLDHSVQDGYVGVITARTTGAANLFLRDRKETYTERMEMTGDGKRFRTRSFEKKLDIDGKVRQNLTLFDYENGIMRSRSWGGGKKDKYFEVKLEPGVYYDGPLTTFYNFRFGAYGPYEDGKVYSVKTFPKENKFPEINLRYNGKDNDSPSDYIVSVLLKKDITGSKSGSIDITFKEDMVPVKAIAKDILLFGDIKGKLKRTGNPSGIVMGNEETQAEATVASPAN